MSPVIATILLVAITVILAAVLYVMVSGMLVGTGNGPQTIGISRADTAADWVLNVVSVPATHALSTTVFLMRWPENSTIVTPPGQATLEALENESGHVKFLPVTGPGQTNLRPSDAILISKSSPYAGGMQILIGDGTTTLWVGTL